MADIPIFKFGVDTSELDEAIAKKKKLEEPINARTDFNRAGGSSSGNGSNGGYYVPPDKRNSNRFHSKPEGINLYDIQKIMRDPKVTGNNSFIALFKENSHKAMLDWLIISKQIDKSQRNFTLIGRNLEAFKTLGVIGGAGIAAYMAIRGAASDIANSDRTAHNLNLQSGQSEAFKTYFSRFNVSDEDLERTENNLQNNSAIFQQNGINPAGMDAEQAWFALAKSAAANMSQWQKTTPNAALTLAHAYYGNQFTDDQLRNFARHYDRGDNVLDEAQSNYEKNWQSMGYSDAQGKQNADLIAHLDSDWQKGVKAWNDGVTTLTPALEHWADAATNFTTGFLDKASKAIADLYNLGTHPGSKPATVVGAGAVEAGQRMRAASMKLRNAFASTPAGQVLGVKPGTYVPASAQLIADSTKAEDFTDYEQLYGLHQGDLNAIEQIESAGGTKLVNPKSGAQGPFQFMPANFAAYGITNPFDEQQEAAAAARKMHQLLKLFHGNRKAAFAAYDWGEGNLQKLMVKHPNDWQQYLPQETRGYLTKATGLGVSFDDRPNAAPETAVASLNTPPNNVPVPTAGEQVLDSLTGAIDRLNSTLREGGGAQFRSPNTPIKVHVDIASPAGSSTIVSAAQTAHAQ